MTRPVKIAIVGAGCAMVAALTALRTLPDVEIVDEMPEDKTVIIGSHLPADIDHLLAILNRGELMEGIGWTPPKERRDPLPRPEQDSTFRANDAYWASAPTPQVCGTWIGFGSTLVYNPRTQRFC